MAEPGGIFSGLAVEVCSTAGMGEITATAGAAIVITARLTAAPDPPVGAPREESPTRRLAPTQPGQRRSRARRTVVTSTHQARASATSRNVAAIASSGDTVANHPPRSDQFGEKPSTAPNRCRARPPTPR